MEKPKLIYQDKDSKAEISPYGEGQYLITQKIFGNKYDESVVLSICELEKALDLAYEFENRKKKKTG